MFRLTIAKENDGRIYGTLVNSCDGKIEFTKINSNNMAKEEICKILEEVVLNKILD